MKYFINSEGIYYIGRKVNEGDIEVPKKPGEFYCFENGEWVINDALKQQHDKHQEIIARDKKLGLSTKIMEARALSIDVADLEEELYNIENPNCSKISCERNKKKSEINSERDKKRKAPVLRNINGEDKYFSVDVLQWDNAALSMDDTQKVQWICEDNSIVEIGRNDIISLCSHIRARNTSTAIAARIQKDEVMALSTITKVKSYKVVM